VVATQENPEDSVFQHPGQLGGDQAVALYI
ncbi:uncharacterized protein METZ01_LOCUS495730, partial [marine metagenome]